jgi:hypothetical protein
MVRKIETPVAATTRAPNFDHDDALIGSEHTQANLPLQAGDNRLPVLAAGIKQAVANARQHAGVSLSAAVEAGKRLVEAKALLKHGQWLPWLNEHVEISERQARNYMRLARDLPEPDIKTAVTADLSIEAALQLLSPPKTFADLIEDAVNKIESVEAAIGDFKRVIEEQEEQVFALRVLSPAWDDICSELKAALRLLARAEPLASEVDQLKSLMEAATTVVELGVEIRLRSTIFCGVLMNDEARP